MHFIPAATAFFQPPGVTSQETLDRGLRLQVPRNGEDWILFLQGFFFFYALHQRKIPLKEEDLAGLVG